MIPTDLPNLRLWLKADAGLFDATSGGGAVTADAAAVARWEDQGGAGNHVTQATSGSRPTLRLNVVNGRPVVRFAFASLQFLQRAGVAWAQPMSFALVVSTTANRNTNGYFGGGASPQAIFYTFTAGTELFAGASLLQGFSAPFGPTRFTGRFDGAASDWYRDGQLLASGNAGANGIADLLIGRVFGGNYLGGDIAELVIGGTAWTDAERVAMEDYLYGRWFGSPLLLRRRRGAA